MVGTNLEDDPRRCVAPPGKRVGSPAPGAAFRLRRLPPTGSACPKAGDPDSKSRWACSIHAAPAIHCREANRRGTRLISEHELVRFQPRQPHGPEVPTGGRLDGIQEAAGSIPVRSTSTGSVSGMASHPPRKRPRPVPPGCAGSNPAASASHPVPRRARVF